MLPVSCCGVPQYCPDVTSERVDSLIEIAKCFLEFAGGLGWYAPPEAVLHT